MREMKDSGLEWIGEIPRHWTTDRIRYTAKLNGRIGWQGLTSKEYQDEGAILVTGINFADGSIDWKQCFRVPFERWQQAPEIQLKNGDLLITKDGTVGKIAIVKDLPEKATLNSGVMKIAPLSSINTKFLYYTLLSDEFWHWFNYKNSGASTIIHLYQNDFYEFKYAIPPLSEQQAIADFLDYKCSELDALVGDIQQQIAILKDYKKSLITKAVTKGLNPNVEMKDSCIEWIGEIPAHWTIQKIKQNFNIVSGSTPSSTVTKYWDGDIVWITPADFKTDDKWVSKGKRNISTQGYRSCNTTMLPEKSIIFSKRAPVGSVIINTVQLCTNQGCLGCIPNANTYAVYFYYVMSVATVEFELVSSGTTFKEISLNEFSNFKLPSPPLSEQQAIADFLDSKCSDIDATIAGKQHQLSILQDYKKSLIYEYVTGKKEVPAHE